MPIYNASLAEEHYQELLHRDTGIDFGVEAYHVGLSCSITITCVSVSGWFDVADATNRASFPEVIPEVDSILTTTGSTPAVVAGATAGVTFVFISGAVLVFLLRKKRRTELVEMPATDNELSRWTIAYELLERQEELASGNFGVVYQGVYNNNECVIKELKSASEEARAELLKEADVLGRLRPHASICAFYGVCVDPGKPFCLVTEFVAGGNLFDLLQDTNLILRDADVRSSARDLASGCAHLHQSSILHCDIAARNCLVTSVNPLRVRICDFGLACVLTKDSLDYFRSVSVAERPYPVRWSAPEVWRDKVWGKASDVWSFGVTVWEIISRSPIPYPNFATNTEVVRFVESGGRLTMQPSQATANCTAQFLERIQACWKDQPMERPAFDDLAAWLRQHAAEQEEDTQVDESTFVRLPERSKHVYQGVGSTGAYSSYYAVVERAVEGQYSTPLQTASGIEGEYSTPLQNASGIEGQYSTPLQSSRHASMV